MTKQTYKTTVDYSLSIKKLVSLGNYDWKNNDIIDGRFSSQKSGKKEVEIVLLGSKKNITFEDVIKKMESEGLRYATLKELLALGIQYPDIQRKDLVVALGSLWYDSCGDIRVPCLDGDDSGRELNLNWWDAGWDPCWLFACVASKTSTLKPLKLKNLDTLTFSKINKKLDKIIKFFSIK